MGGRPEYAGPDTWYGWASDDAGTPLPFSPGSPDGIAITVFEGDGATHYNDMNGWDELYEGLVMQDVTANLAALTPHPNFALMMPGYGQGAGPAAWEASLSFPSKKVTIRGVTARTSNESSVLVSWKVDEITTSSCTDKNGTLKIQVVDPKRFADGVWVAYTLDDFTNCGRAAGSDFLVQSGSGRAYDVNGASVPFYSEMDFTGWF